MARVKELVDWYASAEFRDSVGPNDCVILRSFRVMPHRVVGDEARSWTISAEIEVRHGPIMELMSEHDEWEIMEDDGTVVERWADGVRRD